MTGVTLDSEWAKRVLQEWIQAASEAERQAYPGHQWLDPSPETDRLQVLEVKTARVIQFIMGTDREPELIHSDVDGTLEVRTGSTLARRALGLLLAESEIAEHMPTSYAPSISADGLHQLIWQQASRLMADGHYSAAVWRAASFLTADVKSRVRRDDVADKSLMAEVFSLNPPVAGKPRLRWPGDDSSQTVKAMREGILFFAQGVFSAIRNPATHSTEELSKQVALEQLATLSTLARWIDECELIEA